MLIKGTKIILYNKIQTGEDPLGHPIYVEEAEEVENVLISPMSETEVLDSLTLYGRKAIYQLGIPKGDTHDWTDRKVEFFGKTWHTIGDELEGIEDLIPLEWNKKIRVERIDG